jgi:cytochrome c oxidase assembly protein subunit 15
MYEWYQRVVTFATILALCVVVFGAFVRLSDAGLGCPDWPGCYGSLIVPDESATEAWERPLEAGKAWREMIHRYIAALLGLSILVIGALAWRNRDDARQPVTIPLLLIGLVIFQGLLGMWTVTLLLKPLIVMAHLLGGLATLGLLFWLWVEARHPDTGHGAFHGAMLAALLVLIGQISLGGWTSANYAALACPDIPTCQGEWIPDQMDMKEGFVLWRGLGVDYEFGVLDAPARVAIQYVHRLGAIVTFLTLLGVAFWFLGKVQDARRRQACQFMAAAVVAQVLVGLGVVWFGLPLTLATAHNAFAAVLLLSVINVNHAFRGFRPA